MTIQCTGSVNIIIIIIIIIINIIIIIIIIIIVEIFNRNELWIVFFLKLFFIYF